MSPGSSYMIGASEYDDQPISRTYQYRKVMKPMLERKRRARINRCLDELKELMVSALQSEGENVSKLEKADILELTVRHLHKLRRQHSLGLTPEAAYADRFRAGFTHCAAEVTQYLATAATPATVDPAAGVKLIEHLGSCIRQIDTAARESVPVSSASPVPIGYGNAYTPPASPHHHYEMSPSPNTRVLEVSSPTLSTDSCVWRPW